jgi:transcription initiation factor TFIID subunit 8
LEKKLANAALVQESLKSLIIATEDTKGPEDAELIGHVVNWENAASARKRWRLH